MVEIRLRIYRKSGIKRSENRIYILKLQYYLIYYYDYLVSYLEIYTHLLYHILYNYAYIKGCSILIIINYYIYSNKKTYNN